MRITYSSHSKDSLLEKQFSLLNTDTGELNKSLVPLLPGQIRISVQRFNQLKNNADMKQKSIKRLVGSKKPIERFKERIENSSID